MRVLVVRLVALGMAGDVKRILSDSDQMLPFQLS
ncbi:hypothetical protein C7450_10736 [Chelatococcus asaccharovorans]|uniref:Uncharacterized protein n=1 Tax=Chelatococcus asaccharovorans TaxID=28210 RepID=A0A2V3U380_9HYPH|nr:hypothetical protein C7450_10736 [Chelatococcus asaccharovorans]